MRHGYYCYACFIDVETEVNKILALTPKRIMKEYITSRLVKRKQKGVIT